MSTPHPEGLGARLAMQRALGVGASRRSGYRLRQPARHGDPTNDAAEDKAVVEVFGAGTPCSSTKGATGHLLGAAGITEAVVSMLALRHGLVPGSAHTRASIPRSRAQLRARAARGPFAARADEFVRLRRQQLQPGDRRCALILRASGCSVPGCPDGRRAAPRSPASSPTRARPRRFPRASCCRRPSAAAPESRSGSRSPPARRRSPPPGATPRPPPRCSPLPRADGQILHEICARLPVRARGVADALHELGAQRRRRLLEHRDALARAFDEPLLLRRELCRRGCSSARPRSPWTAGHGAHRLRRALSRAAARHAADPRRVRRRARARAAADAGKAFSMLEVDRSAVVPKAGWTPLTRRSRRERLRNPAARSLPLLAALARGRGRGGAEVRRRARACARGSRRGARQGRDRRHDPARGQDVPARRSGGLGCRAAIRCVARGHRDADNPLRAGGELPALCGIEYAAQAMAAHGRTLGGGRARRRAPATS